MNGVSFDFPMTDSQAAKALNVSPPTRSMFEGLFVRAVVYSDAKKGAKPNQEDAVLAWVSPSGKVTVGAVFDGHGGYNGLLASNAARDQMAVYLDANRFGSEGWTPEDWTVRLRALFGVMHRAIRERLLTQGQGGGQGAANNKHSDEKGIVRFANGFPVHGGTTASVVVQVVNSDGTVSLIGANVGDSSAVFVDHVAEAFSFLTEDHGPENPYEFARVQALPVAEHPEKLLFVYDKTDVSRKYECPPVFHSDGSKDMQLASAPWANGLHPTNARYEPAVYAVTPRSITRDSTCIAMTRALGDFYAHQFGLTFEPSFKVARLPAGSRFSVYVASDGVWDCWKYEDWTRACLSVHKKTRPQSGTLAIGSSLLSVSVQRAIASFGAQHFDDASLVCWQYPPEPQASA